MSEFVKGDTYEVGDCGNFESGIDHLTVDGNILTPQGVGTNPNKPPKLWGHRIAVYGTTAQQAEELRDRLLNALLHASTWQEE